MAALRTEKTCSCCRRLQPLAAFGRNRQTVDGLNYYCKTCAADKQSRWAAANPQKAKAAKVKYLARIRATNTLRGDPHRVAD